MCCVGFILGVVGVSALSQATVEPCPWKDDTSFGLGKTPLHFNTLHLLKQELAQALNMVPFQL